MVAESFGTQLWAVVSDEGTAGDHHVLVGVGAVGVVRGSVGVRGVAAVDRDPVVGAGCGRHELRRGVLYVPLPLTATVADVYASGRAVCPARTA